MQWKMIAPLLGTVLALVTQAPARADPHIHIHSRPGNVAGNSPVAAMIPGILSMVQRRGGAGAWSHPEAGPVPPFVLRRALPVPAPHTVPRPVAPPVPGRLVLECVVAGEPVEMPDDILISNPYSFAIGPGVEVAYSAPLGNSGVAVLPFLAPGQSVYVRDALRGGLAPGVGCTAVQTK